MNLKSTHTHTRARARNGALKQHMIYNKIYVCLPRMNDEI